MNTLWLSSIGLLFLIAGCVSTSTVRPSSVEQPLAPRSSDMPETTREFHIPGTDAPTALNEFSRQADTQVPEPMH